MKSRFWTALFAIGVALAAFASCRARSPLDEVPSSDGGISDAATDRKFGSYNPSLAADAGTPPGGSDTQVQYNNAGTFAGSAVTYDGTTFTFPTTIKQKNGANVGTISFTPTASRTITIPDVTGTVAILDATQTLTNKTVNCANNTCTVRAASDVTGILPIANGGTHQSALGSSLQVLRTNSGATDTEWATVSSGLSAPSGTGFWHITAASSDAAAKLVDLGGGVGAGAAGDLSNTKLGIGNGGTGLSAVGANHSVPISNGSVLAYGLLDNTNLSGSAGITSGQIAAGGASTVLTTNAGASATAWATIVDANVNAAAAIAGTKISPNFGAQNGTTSGNWSLTGASSTFTLSGGTAPSIVMTTGSPFIQLGGTPSTTGQLRMTSAAVVAARNAGNTADVNLVRKISDDAYFGDGTNATNSYGLSKSTGTVGLVNNATVIAQATSAAFEVASGKNFSVGATAPTYGSGTNEVFMSNAGTEPSTNPTSGVLFYAKADGSSSALRMRTPSGFVEQFGGARLVITTAHTLTVLEAAHREWRCNISGGGTVTVPVGGGADDDVFDRVILAQSDCLMQNNQAGRTLQLHTGNISHVMFDKNGVYLVAAEKTITYP